MTPWIELRQSLTTHKKMRRLVRTLGLGYPDGIPQTIGHLCMFWLWSADNTQDGNLDGLDAQDIADAACWPNDPDDFVDALVACGFIETCDDGTMCIHDWQEHIGRHIKARERDAERKRKLRHSQQLAPDPVEDTEWQKVVLAYEQNIGMVPNGIAGEMLVSYMQDLTADVVIKAIEITNESQPTNAWQYLKSILDKWADLQINTVEKAEAYKKDLRRRISEAKRRKQQQTAPTNEPPAITGQFY